MRVLHLTTEFPPVIYGGLGTALGGMVRASARAGISVGVLLAGHGGEGGYHLVGPAGASRSRRLAAAARRKIGRREARGAASEPTAAAGASIFSVATTASIEASLRVVERFAPDVVHLHAFWLWPMACAIREQTGVPLVCHVHSLDRAEYEIGQGPPECLSQWNVQLASIRAADRVIALTRSERELIVDYCPEVRDRIRIVANGIDDYPAARHAAARASSRAASSESPTVLFAGRFVERKGVRELIAAIPQVLARMPATRFVLAGGQRLCSGEEMAHWWLPAGFAHRDRVHFTGWLTAEQLGTWYAQADVLVVPSWYEPFGMVVLEGMLHGLAVVAADVGGPAEILEHERTGVLCPPRDAGALAGAILRVLGDPRDARRIRRAAAVEVRRRWGWSNAVEQLHAVYAEVAQPA